MDLDAVIAAVFGDDCAVHQVCDLLADLFCCHFRRFYIRIAPDWVLRGTREAGVVSAEAHRKLAEDPGTVGMHTVYQNFCTLLPVRVRVHIWAQRGIGIHMVVRCRGTGDDQPEAAFRAKFKIVDEVFAEAAFLVIGEATNRHGNHNETVRYLNITDFIGPFQSIITHHSVPPYHYYTILNRREKGTGKINSVRVGY